MKALSHSSRQPIALLGGVLKWSNKVHASKHLKENFEKHWQPADDARMEGNYQLHVKSLGMRQLEGAQELRASTHIKLGTACNMLQSKIASTKPEIITSKTLQQH